MFYTRIALPLLLLVYSAVSADTLATLTFLQGEAELIRGTQRFTLSEGVKLDNADIVALKGHLMQIEMTDGTILLLAPETRLMLLAGKAKPPQIFLQQGAVKMLTSKPAQLNTANWQLNLNNGALAVRTQARDLAAFLEQGALKLTPPRSTKTSSIELKSGEFYQTTGTEKEHLLQRPTPAFIAALPRSFLDTPSSRLARFDKPVAAKAAGSFDYPEVADWLSGPEAIRKILLQQWRSKASEPAFRAALQANMSKHMEWDRIVNPQKYEKKLAH